MIRICSALSEAGHEVELIGRKKGDSQSLASKNYKQTRLNCWFEKGKIFYLEFNIRLFFYLLGKSNYLLTSIDLDTSITGLMLWKLRGKPFYFDAHEMFTEVPEVIDRKKVQKIWLKIEERVFQHASKVYTVGFALKGFFEERHQRQDISVVRNVPALRKKTDFFKLDFVLPDSPFILYQGALNKGRGLERLIQILKDYSLNYPLVLVGDGDIRHELQNMVNSVGLKKQVYFVGQVSPDFLPEISRRARIGYNVSENLGLSYYYSLNNKFFDYVEAELPSVINNFPEYVEHCKEFQVGILVSNESKEIANALKTLMEEDSKYQNIKNQCTLARNVWNWEQEKQILMDLYKDFKDNQ
jgi:glycosyltransferase involved in cell wall biosynthesis